MSDLTTTPTTIILFYYLTVLTTHLFVNLLAEPTPQHEPRHQHQHIHNYPHRHRPRHLHKYRHLHLPTPTAETLRRPHVTLLGFLALLPAPISNLTKRQCWQRLPILWHSKKLTTTVIDRKFPKRLTFFPRVVLFSTPRRPQPGWSFDTYQTRFRGTKIPVLPTMRSTLAEFTTYFLLVPLGILFL